jgi:hypothetical protein
MQSTTRVEANRRVQVLLAVRPATNTLREYQVPQLLISRSGNTR